MWCLVLSSWASYILHALFPDLSVDFPARITFHGRRFSCLTYACPRSVMSARDARDAATTAGPASPPPTFRHPSFLSSILSPWDALRSPTSAISTESENGQTVSTGREPGEPPGREGEGGDRILGAPFLHNPPATTNTHHSVSGLPLIMSSV